MSDEKFSFGKVILYSNHCPKCEILKKKLDSKNIVYELFDNVDEMLKKGFDSMPVLEINGSILNFKEANDWVNSAENFMKRI